MTDLTSTCKPRDKSTAAEALRAAAEAIIQYGHDRTIHTVMDVSDYLTDTADRIEEESR